MDQSVYYYHVFIRMHCGLVRVAPQQLSTLMCSCHLRVHSSLVKVVLPLSNDGSGVDDDSVHLRWMSHLS